MDYFTGHKLIKTQNGYTVVLYINQQLSEFSKEFFDAENPNEIGKKYKKTITQYIKKNLPTIKVATVTISIMLGTMLVTSFNLNTNAVPTGSDNNQVITESPDDSNKIQPEEDIKESNPKDNEQNDNSHIIESEKDDAVIDDNTSIVSNPSNILVLVNKNNSLSSNYVPKDLIVPNVPFSFQEYNEKKLMRKEAATALEDLFAGAKKENINLYAVSGYRSYNRQKTIFDSNVKKYGFQKANQFSAQPGQSEHQTGLTIDVSSSSVNMRLTQSFGETKEGKWLAENAHKSGFIIRYPKGKTHITGYQYEPWHIRYVGIESAKEIATQKITLEQYLENIT